MLRGSLLALTACALGGASTSPAPEAAGACLTVQSKVTFPVVLGRSRLQNQTLDGGAEVVLRVPPGETLWMLPKGVQWHGDPAPGGDGPMNPDATRPDDAAVAREPESRQESLGGPDDPLLPRLAWKCNQFCDSLRTLPEGALWHCDLGPSAMASENGGDDPDPGETEKSPEWKCHRFCDSLRKLPKGVLWHCSLGPGPTTSPGSHAAPIGDGDPRDGPAPPDATRRSIPHFPVWMGFVEAAGRGGAGAAAAREPESRQESLGGPGETGDAVETDDMVLGIGDSMVAGVRLSGGELAADGPCLRVVLEGCKRECHRSQAFFVYRPVSHPILFVGLTG